MSTASTFRLKADQLKPLSVRSNAPAAMHALGHIGAIVLGAIAIWAALGTWWALWPLMVLQGYFIAFLFTLEHETAHQTAFSARKWNYLLGHFSGFAIGLPYEYYRAYHWDHHRYTQDPAKDPELSVPLPTSKLGLIWYWSGLPNWGSRLKILFVHGVLGRVNAPWITPDKSPLITREARFYLAGYALVAAVSIAFQSMAVLWLWVIPVMLGQLFLRPYLLSEHTGCAHTSNMLENTRTTYTNRLVRFFAWNMPYHIEHHAYPSVPFHALPRLNALLATHSMHTEQGYFASTNTVLRYLNHNQASNNGTGSADDQRAPT